MALQRKWDGKRICSACNGTGYLSDRGSTVGRFVCSSCGGSGIISRASIETDQATKSDTDRIIDLEKRVDELERKLSNVEREMK
jgi:DnaJ-class molecular chaperone